MTLKVKIKALVENPYPNWRMANEEALKQRMFKGRLLLAESLGYAPTLQEIGHRVAELSGQEKPAAPSVVRRWLNGRPPERLAVMAALAQVLQVDPGWLYFGDASTARGPSEDSPESIPSDVIREGFVYAARNLINRAGEDLSPDLQQTLRQQLERIFVDFRRRMEKQENIIDLQTIAFEFVQAADNLESRFEGLRGQDLLSSNSNTKQAVDHSSGHATSTSSGEYAAPPSPYIDHSRQVQSSRVRKKKA